MAVTSVFGRDGDVVKAEGDYNLTDLGDVTITSPTNGQALTFNNTSSEWENSTLPTQVAGSDRQIQFNNSGAFGADAALAFTAEKNLALGTGAGLQTPDLTAPPALDIVGGTTNAMSIRMTDVLTDATNKNMRMVGRHYDSDEESATIFGMFNQSAVNSLRFGGGFGSHNAATEMKFYTTATNTTLTGSIHMELSGDGILSVDADADGDVIRIKQGGTQEGQISVSANTVTYAAFVGVHPSQPMVGQATPPIGAVLISNGEKVESELTIWEKEPEGTATVSETARTSTGLFQRIANSFTNLFAEPRLTVVDDVKREFYNIRLPESLPESERAKFTRKLVRVPEKEIYVHVSPTTQAADSRVYGVFVAQVADNTREKSFGQNDVPEWNIAGVGHYKVRVTDLGGNIANGDYLTSSTRAYEAQRQADDVLHSYTVGKALIDVDWADVAVDPTLGYKWALVPATLHCG